VKKTYTVEVDVASPSYVARCPVGHELRLAAVLMELSPGAALGEVFLMEAIRGPGVTVWAAQSNPLVLDVNTICAAVGLVNTVPTIEIIDPVTGVVTVTLFSSRATTPLPDIWLPYDVTFSAQAPGSATITACRFTIEERSL